MISLMVIAGTIAIVEIVYRIRVKYRHCGIEIASILKESTRVIRCKEIPDSSKEIQLRRCAVKLFMQSSALFGYLLITIFPLAIILVVDYVRGGNVVEYLLTPIGMFLSIIVAGIYITVRKRIGNG